MFRFIVLLHHTASAELQFAISHPDTILLDPLINSEIGFSLYGKPPRCRGSKADRNADAPQCYWEKAFWTDEDKAELFCVT